jgi:hypothetical protein
LRHGTCVAAQTRSRELGLQQTAAAGGKTDVEIRFTLGSAWKVKKFIHILNFHIHESHYFILI